MVTALLASVSGAWTVADTVASTVLFLWFTVAMVFMFAHGGRRSMPLVAAIGIVGAILLSMLILWATAAQP